MNTKLENSTTCTEDSQFFKIMYFFLADEFLFYSIILRGNSLNGKAHKGSEWVCIKRGLYFVKQKNHVCLTQRCVSKNTANEVFHDVSHCFRHLVPM